MGELVITVAGTGAVALAAIVATITAMELLGWRFKRLSNLGDRYKAHVER